MKKILYIFALVVFSQTLLAQQNNTMYFMQSLPQATWLNPAVQNECKLHIGGALVPVTGQVLLPIHFNYGNNGFAIKDMIQFNPKTDTFILPFFKDVDKNGVEKKFDWELLESNLRDVNYITTEFHINWLTVGFKYKKWNFGFDYNDKIESRFSFNEDLLIFGKEGNGERFLHETANLGDIGITATHYSEAAFNVSRQINDKLTIGLTAKLLFGKLNVWTERSIIDVTTDNSENYPINVDADIVIHSSQPFSNVQEMYYDYEADSMIVETVENDINPMDMVFNTKNFGLGFDLGAIYNVTDKISLYASLTDMGYINWTDNTQTFSIKGNYTWDGYDFQPSLTDDEAIITEADDSLKHHIINIFEPNLQRGSYVSYLTPKAYIGGTYQFHDKIRAGLLLRSSFFQNDWHPSVTLSGNFRVTKWFEATASYSMINNSYSNVGLGWVAKAKWFQFFMMTDNLMGFILPQNTRNINFRMGMNLIFGCKKKETTTLIGG